jgi:hypothetical protein
MDLSIIPLDGFQPLNDGEKFHPVVGGQAEAT